jgi:hypothetical protein
VDVFALTPETEAFYAAAARAAAAELGILDHLDAPHSVAELAAATATRPRRLAALLDALCLDGTLRRDGPRFARGTWRPTPAQPRQGWGLLAEVLRSDRPLPDDPACATFQGYLAEAGAAPARALVAALAGEAGPLVDLGGGAGTYAAAWLDARPDDRALLVDRPAVSALAEVGLRRFGARARVRAADLFADDLGSGHGVALLSNVLHLYPAEACRALIARAAAMLASGGAVVVKDLFIHPDRSGPARGVYFALNMALYTDGGTVHDAGAIGGWLVEAGLRLEPVGAHDEETIVLIGRRER